MLRPITAGLRLGTRELVAMLAGLMALNALALDAMLPALAAIGGDLHLPDENDRQLVILAYMAGVGSTQLVWGPLADRFGRKRVLAAGLLLYILFAGACAVAMSFSMLITARLLQGAAGAVTRVVAVAMVRDMLEGEAMARVMSLVHMVFMVVPILAPSLGQAILLVAPWRAIFAILALSGLIMLLWSTLRLPESLRPEYRRTLAWRDLAAAARLTLSERQSLGYTLAMTVTFGSLVAYIASIQQIVFDVFRTPDAIGLVFAAIAAPMAVCSLANSLLVGRYGLRRIGHSGVVAFALFGLLHWLVALLMPEPLWLFVVLQALMMASFSFASANLGTLAMAHMAPIAGTASSIQGMITSVGSVLIGLVIGQAFDGSQLPFLTGVAACGLVALLITTLTEPRRLFERRPGDRPELPPPAAV